MGSQRDITEPKKAEEALRKSEEKYSSVVENSMDGIIVLQKGIIKFLNQAIVELSGYNLEELIDKEFETFLSPEYRKLVMDRYQARLAGKEVPSMYEMEIIRKDGISVPIEVSNKTITYGGEKATLSFIRNITERKQAEEEIRLHAVMMDNVAEGIYLIGLDDLIIKWTNEKFERMFGYDPGEMVGKQVDLINAPTERTPTETRISIVDVLKETGEWHGEVRNIKRDGTHFWCYANVSLFDHPEYGRVIVSAHTDITERKCAEEALRASRDYLENLTNSMWDVVFSVKMPERVIEWVNDSFRLIGYEPSECIGKDTTFLYADKDDFLDFGNKLKDAIAAGKDVLHTDQLLKRKSGETFPAEITVTFHRENNEVVSVTSIVRDITERKQAEEALRESKEFAEGLIFSMQDGFSVLNSKSEHINVNDSFCNMTGFSQDELIGVGVPHPYWPPEEYENIQKAFKKTLQGDFADLELTFMRKNGERFPVIVSPSRLKDRKGEVISYYATIKDITDRKRAEEALKESENRFHELFDPMSSGVAVYEAIDYGSDFIIKDYNKAGERISKVNREHIVGRSVLEVFPGIKKFGLFEVFQRVWKIGESEDHPVSLYQDDCLTHWAENYVYKLPSGEIVIVFDDVTERVQVEEELQRSQEELRNLADYLQTVREEERTTIAREIHDELAQALTALKMDISWLSKKLPKDQKTLLEKTRAMTKLTDTTIKTVKRISTELRPGLLDDLGLVAAIEWQAEEFKNRTGITCRLDVDAEDIMVEEKRSTTLFRIFQEALTNVARHAHVTAVTVSLKEKDSILELRVRDNGRGITKEQISDPQSFGLMGIRERAKSWGGEVKISGIEGKGTTVVVRISMEN